MQMDGIAQDARSSSVDDANGFGSAHAFMINEGIKCRNRLMRLHAMKIDEWRFAEFRRKHGDFMRIALRVCVG